MGIFIDRSRRMSMGAQSAEVWCAAAIQSKVWSLKSVEEIGKTFHKPGHGCQRRVRQRPITT